MPLAPGSSHQVIANNIREMQNAGYPHHVAVAAAMRNAYGPPRRAAGGFVPDDGPSVPGYGMPWGNVPFPVVNTVGAGGQAGIPLSELPLSARPTTAPQSLPAPPSLLPSQAGFGMPADFVPPPDKMQGLVGQQVPFAPPPPPPDPAPPPPPVPTGPPAALTQFLSPYNSQLSDISARAAALGSARGGRQNRAYGGLAAGRHMAYGGFAYPAGGYAAGGFAIGGASLWDLERMALFDPAGLPRGQGKVTKIPVSAGAASTGVPDASGFGQGKTSGLAALQHQFAGAPYGLPEHQQIPRLHVAPAPHPLQSPQIKIPVPGGHIQGLASAIPGGGGGSYAQLADVGGGDDDVAETAARGGAYEFAGRTERDHGHPDLGPDPVGLIKSSVAGRTDKIPTKVAAGSYIFPADVVSGMGEGNTITGGKVLDRMLGPPSPMPGDKVDVILAGGEYIAHPSQLLRKFGDLHHAHDSCDAFVKAVRARTIKQLEKMPGPKR